MRIGVMGCGHVADFGHVPAIKETPGLELVALFDPNRQRLNELADKYDVVGRYTSPEAFFDQRLDAVLVASPVGAHKENVLMAADRGVHVLCEKPLAPTEGDSAEMAAAMRRAGKLLFTAFVYRFSQSAQQIRSWVREGIVGEVRALRLVYVWDLHGQWEQDEQGEWVESARFRGRMLEGGPLVDCGVHQIDLARWWLGSEVSSFTSAGAWVADYEAPDHLYLHMDHESGAHTTVEVSFTFGHTAREPFPIFSYHLIGTGGVIRYERNGYLLEARHGQGTIRVPGTGEKDFHGMYAALVRAFETGDVGDLASPEDGIVATRISSEATKAAIALRKQTPIKERQILV
jgi:predicted dehydrogenase